MNHEKWHTCPNFEFTHTVYYKGQDAGNSADGLFTPFDTAVFRDDEGHQLKALIMTVSFEREAHFSSFFFIYFFFLLHINPRGYSEWRGDDMIFVWAMSQQALRRRLKDLGLGATERRGGIKTLGPNGSSHVSLNISWRSSSIVFFVWNKVGSLEILCWPPPGLLLGVKRRGFHHHNITAHTPQLNTMIVSHLFFYSTCKNRLFVIKLMFSHKSS